MRGGFLRERNLYKQAAQAERYPVRIRTRMNQHFCFEFTDIIVALVNFAGT